ncbi:MAG: histidinol-phosphatase [Robiginitomaculum sp.]|nr:MAG: histidinol-phosphatase [Robiginitomaculum sp.]
MSKTPKPQDQLSSLPRRLGEEERAKFGRFSFVLADAAAKVTLAHFDTPIGVEVKPDHPSGYDPVTIADRGAERAIRDLLDHHYPDHGIRGEEYGVKDTISDFSWVLDPIDGTRAFISALPVWGTLIALTRNGRPVLGLMDQPVTGERFFGLGDKAWLYKHGQQQRQLKTRSCEGLHAATLCTTDPTLFTKKERPAFEVLRETTRLQRYGLDCYAYAALARGGVDLVIESGLQDYDIAALIPIVEGAGGTVTNWSGGTAWQGGQVLASGDARVHDEALAHLADAAL